MTWRAYGDFRAPFEGRAFIAYALRVAEESARLEIYRVLVSESLRLQGQGLCHEAKYLDIAYRKEPTREPSLEEIIEGAGLEVTHEPA